MTRRERKEQRLTRRLEWAAGRRDQAGALEAANDRFRGDVAFNTQPGHIPERARAIRRSERAWEHRGVAAHHESEAAGIADQLDRSIFSDDPDAQERLRERIAELEADRDRQKKINSEIRRGAGWEQRLAVASITLTEQDKADLLAIARHQPYLCKDGRPVFPSYHFQNLGGNIRRLRERLATIEATRKGA